jgi:molecular chaperone GrpE
MSTDTPSPEMPADTMMQPEQPADAATAEQLAPDPRIAALEAERDEFKDRWMRGEAEMANLRARTRREVEDARQYAVQKFARDVAEAADDLRRGLESVPQSTEGDSALFTKLREGLESVERSFLAMLERNGVARSDPSLKPFDANLHQAMAEQPSAEHPPGTVLQAWTPVWTLNGRLLRPAMVVVARADKPQS